MDWELTGQILSQKMTEILFDGKKYKTMSEAAKNLARWAAREIAEKIFKLSE